VDGQENPLSLIQYLDFKTWLPGDILTKVDRASMAHSLEVRVPLLDHEFCEYAATLPPSLKLRGGEGKYILKKALEPHLPHDIMYRSKKGFSIPLAAWLRGPLRDAVQEAVLGKRLEETGRSLDIAEEEGDIAGREVALHGRVDHGRAPGRAAGRQVDGRRPSARLAGRR